MYCIKVVLSLNNPSVSCIYLLSYCCWLFIFMLNEKTEEILFLLLDLTEYIFIIYIYKVRFFFFLLLLRVSLCKWIRIDKRMTLWNHGSPTPADKSINFLFRNLFVVFYLWAYHQGVSQRILIIRLSLIRVNYYLKKKIDLQCPIWPYLHEIIQSREDSFFFLLLLIWHFYI
jgi:hypothetical protein